MFYEEKSLVGLTPEKSYNVKIMFNVKMKDINNVNVTLQLWNARNESIPFVFNEDWSFFLGSSFT